MEYSIGDLSKITRVSGKTLQKYHNEGLVVPTRIDKFSARRYYDEKSLHRVEVVRHFHSLGIPSEIIKDVLAKHKDTRHLIKLLLSDQKEARHTWEKLGLAHDQVQAFLHTQSLEKGQVGNLEIKVLPDIFVACERFHGTFADIDSHIDHMTQICGSISNGFPIILFLDDHQYEDEMDMECCLPVNQEIPVSGITFRSLPGTKAVTVVYSGPSAGIWMGYQKIIDHLNKHHLAIQTPSREVRLDGGVAELSARVEIQFLIGDPNDPNFKRDISRPGFGIGANFDL